MYRIYLILSEAAASFVVVLSSSLPQKLTGARDWRLRPSHKCLGENRASRTHKPRKFKSGKTFSAIRQHDKLIGQQQSRSVRSLHI